MFDGNFRSGRREVNFAGISRPKNNNNNNSNTTHLTKKNASDMSRGRRDLLKNAELQRKQRHAQLRREKAARLVQRLKRGYLSRMHLLQHLLLLPQRKQPQQVAIRSRQQPPPQTVMTMTSLSMCLSYHSYLPKLGTNRRTLLLEYYDGIQNRQRSTILEHAMIQNHASSNWFSQKRIVYHILQELTPAPTSCNNDESTTEEEALFQLLNMYWISTHMDDQLFLALTTCLQTWCMATTTAATTTTKTTLTHWSKAACQQLPNPYCQALLATILLSSPVGDDHDNNDISQWLDALTNVLIMITERNKKNTNRSMTTNPLVENLSTKTTTTTMFSVNDPVLQATLDNLQNGREYNLLSNLLGGYYRTTESESKSSSPPLFLLLLLLLIHYVLSQPQNETLRLVVALMARGDNNINQNNTLDESSLASNNKTSKNQQGAVAHDQGTTTTTTTDWDDELEDTNDVDDDDDNNMDDDGDEQAASNNNKSRPQTDAQNDNTTFSSHNSKRQRAGTYQYKRQELLTMVKLDKLYHERIQQQVTTKKVMFSSLDVTIRDVAKKIVDAPWVAFGIHVFLASSSSGQQQQQQERYYFIETLSILLQASSALRPKTKLTPLSSLAFNRTVMEGIWYYAQNDDQSSDNTTTALCVFADLFSHYLVPLSDQDFVRLHCVTTAEHDYVGGERGGGQNNTNNNNRILASDLVTCYTAVLYELYWTKPVASYDMEMDNVRGRLILSGTKLWNSLYERWNRLPFKKNSFCTEDAWWFPHLSSRASGAVIPVRERQDHAMNNQWRDEEDSDDDDDDDQMDIDQSGTDSLTALEAESDALADSFRDPKMARILTSIPQALPFDRRVKMFHSLLKADKRKTMQTASSLRALMAMVGQDDEGIMFLDGSVREQIRIRRSHLYEDSMERLNNIGTRLKHQIQVTFVNAHGTEEAGIDGGGMFKEFVDDLIKDGFATKSDDGVSKGGGAPQLFSVTPEGLLSVNLDLTDNAAMLVHYGFLGRVLSKAVYEGILVEPQFCLPFLNLLLGKVNTLEDLKNYDEEYYMNLNKLRHFSDAEIESAGLSFELTVGGTTPGSTPRTVELIRNGRSVPVTRKNVFQYTHAVANQLLNVQGAKQTRAFLDGFRGIIPVSWVRLFSAKELQKLISGDDSVRGIDVASLKRHMRYLGGYHESQPYIQDFWDILENELSPEQQRKFLRFMTSCSRQPLLGFSSLEPVPCIQQIHLRDDELSKNSRLPTSQTCMNLLKLPNYQNRQLLKTKLLAAVEADAGFELT